MYAPLFLSLSREAYPLIRRMRAATQISADSLRCMGKERTEGSQAGRFARNLRYERLFPIC